LKKPVSLRAALTTLTILLTVFAVLVAGTLVVVTTILRHTMAGVGASVESIRLAEDAEIDLLLHERARDLLVRRDLEGDLQRKLVEAQQFVTAEDEVAALAEAKSRIDAYIAVAHDPLGAAAEQAARHEAAYGALERLITMNVAQSNAAQQEAARWDALANLIGIGIGVPLVVVAGALLVWLRGRAFAPIFALAAVMERFGRGDRDARAAEQGPRELREMCARFNEMASAIAAQRQAQMAFLGGVAHDLRNPLSALQMAVALLRLDEPHPSEDRVRQTVERIGRQITRMERMLGDFLDMAKIEAGQLELRMETHDARSIVEEVVGLFEGTSERHQLEVRLPDRAVPVRCDHLRIEQVITNLISNAIKYSPPGSTIEVALDAGADEVELSVADHGVGISEEDRACIFEPFRRVGPSTEAVPGMGLGLFVVRKIVEEHRGRIEVDTAPEEGSTFRVFLPIGRDRG
jgi:two-component system, OmpR family, sensor histidine kinase MtrB